MQDEQYTEVSPGWGDLFPQGCTAFKPISSNKEREESGIKDDSGMQDVQYTELSLRGLGRGGGIISPGLYSIQAYFIQHRERRIWHQR